MYLMIWIALISIASVFIPLSLAVIQWRKLPPNISMIRWLLVISLACDITAAVMGIIFSIPNKLVVESYMFIQFALLLYMLGNQFEQSRTLRVGYITLVVIHGVSVLVIENYDMLNALVSLVLIIISILFFYKLLSELKVVNIHRLPILWVALATLFYYSGNLFVFLASNYLINKTDYFLEVWALHNILNITKNLFFAVALWQGYRTMKLSV